MGDAAKDLVRLRAVLARGATLQKAGQKVGRSAYAAYRLAVKHDLPRRRRSLPPEKTSKIQRELARENSRQTLTRIAELAGCSVATVWRHANRLPKGAPRSVRKYRCSGCRYDVTLSPCQICAARASAVPKSRPMPDGVP